MRILFHLGHPAHFHLFKNVIHRLKEYGNIVDILLKKKDVLTDLIEESGLDYVNILKEGNTSGKIYQITNLLKRGRKLISWCLVYKPDVLIGTSADISYIGKLLGIPTLNLIEDDASVIPVYAWMAYPWATAIISPDVCDNGRWSSKTHSYPGYHELAYLHPDHFVPDKDIVQKYTTQETPYFILRFTSLTAHHDRGIQGINDEVAVQLINSLKQYGQVFITSERTLSPELEAYRFSINPADIHHLLAYAKLVIGDSQTMSAEAGVLGTPYIRFNDFVGKIGYLRELEEKYELGYGFRPEQKDLMIQKALELASAENTTDVFQQRRQIMLADKINVADFLYEYISQKKWVQ